MTENAFKLGNHIDEARERLGKNTRTVYSVTNVGGFVPSLEQFDKQVFSKDTSKYKLVNYGDLAYNPSRINVGSVAICPDPAGGAVSPMYVIIHCRSTILPKYLLYFLKSAVGLAHIHHRCKGSVRFQLKFKELQQIPIYLPPRDEQERIVRILDEAESLSKLRSKADRRTADLIPAIFNDMFGDPTTNPKRWRIDKLDNVASTTSGGTPDRKNPAYFGGSIPWVKSGELNQPVVNQTEEFLTQVGFENSSAKWQPPGTVLLALYGATVGVTSLLGIRATTNQAVCSIQPGGEVKNIYLLQILKSKTPLLLQQRFGGAQPNISQKIVRNLKIPVPPLSLQQKFAARVAEVRKLELQQADSRKHLDDLFQSLLHLAFKGELISMKAAEQVRATTPYKDDAAVVCFLLAEFEKLQRPTTEFFIQKHIFVTKHHLHLPVNSVFKRKVAGPWSQELRWKAIEAAIKMNWLRCEKKRFVAGSAFEKALSHAATVLGEGTAQIAQLVEDLKTFGQKGLERWTTVLKVVEDLKETRQPITRTNIQHEINNWPDKSLKEIFTEKSINHTIKMMLKHNWLPTSAGQ